jgi:EmrB/QacA subfamily drug resistance transporter
MSKYKHGISYKWFAMAVASMGTLMGTIDMGGIRVVLPNLEQVFHSSPDIVVWVSLIWVLVGSSLMLSMARAADIFGRKKFYNIGLAIFILGLALCSLAQNITQLILFRFIQSFGAAMTITIEYALVTAAFPTKERGRALGIMAGIAGLGLLAGPALAGLCLDLFGWRSFFYLRIPFAVITIVMSQVLLKAAPSNKNREKFDLIGAITFFIALSCLLVGLTQGQRLGWLSPWIISLICVGVLVLISFLVVEKKIAHPVLDLKMFRNRLFSVAVVSHILLYVSTAGVNFAMPFYLIDSLGFNASKAGLLLVTLPAITLVFSPFSGKISDKLGSLVLCASGFILIALGLFLLCGATIETSIGSIVFYLFLIGAGLGLFTSPNTSAIIGAVHGGNLSSASAMAGTLRHLGMSIGMAVSGGVFTVNRFSHANQLASQGLPQNMAAKLSTVNGFQNTILIGLIIAVVGLLVSLSRGRTVQKS